LQASVQKWWAIFRTFAAFCPEETVEKHGGKTAVKWAEFFGEDDLAQEMQYYFVSIEFHGIPGTDWIKISILF